MASSQRMIYQTAATRELILECAYRVFTEQGFFDAQMKDIAHVVGMSRHTLYRYYQDKTDLGFAILEQAIGRWQNQIKKVANEVLIQSELNGIERIERLLRTTFGYLQEDPELLFMAEFDAYFSSSRAPTDFRERIMSFVDLETLNLTEEIFRQAQADGSVRSDKSAETLVRVVTESLVALRQRLALRGNLLIELSTDDRSSLVNETLDLLLAGLAPTFSRGETS